MSESSKAKAIEEIREYQNLISEAEYYDGKDNELRLAKYSEANKMKIRQKYTSAQIREASRMQESEDHSAPYCIDLAGQDNP